MSIWILKIHDLIQSELFIKQVVANHQKHLDNVKFNPLKYMQEYLLRRTDTYSYYLPLLNEPRLCCLLPVKAQAHHSDLAPLSFKLFSITSLNNKTLFKKELQSNILISTISSQAKAFKLCVYIESFEFVCAPLQCYTLEQNTFLKKVPL